MSGHGLAALSILRGLGLSGLVRGLGRGPSALYYHGLSDPGRPGQGQGQGLSILAFEAQVRFLKRHYQVISLDRLAQGLASGQGLSPRQALITFDDGLFSHLCLAAPLLASLDLPFAVFINSESVETGRRLPTWVLRQVLAQGDLASLDLPSQGLKFSLGDQASREQVRAQLTRLIKTRPQAQVRALEENLRAALSQERWREIEAAAPLERPLSWKEVKRLAELGAAIGSHCHEHAILHGQQPSEEARAQLELSRQAISAHLGTCPYLAYPNGKRDDISPEALRLARQAGYQLAFTTQPGQISAGLEPLALPRFPAPGGADHLRQLEWMLLRRR